jgi:hypothetical protein
MRCAILMFSDIVTHLMQEMFSNTSQPPGMCFVMLEG